jgi:hypothetical protein
MTHPVDQIITEKFATLAASSHRKAFTSPEQAAYLDISDGHLSRLRHGKVQLSPGLAERIAHKLEPESKLHRDALKDLLLRAAGASSVASPEEETSISIVEAASLFSELSQEDALLVVTYTELPQAIAGAPQSRLAKAAGEAVAHGLSFAMFQPFGTLEGIERLRARLIAKADERDFPPPLQVISYMSTVADNVRKVWNDMRSAAEVEHQRMTEVGDDQASGSIVLFEATAPPSGAYVGVHPRQFFAHYRTQEDQWTQRAFEWVVGKNEKHYFIEMDHSAIDPVIIRDQFYPITTDWIKKCSDDGIGRLPQNQDELADIYSTYRTNRPEKTVDEQPLFWTIYRGEK